MFSKPAGYVVECRPGSDNIEKICRFYYGLAGLDYQGVTLNGEKEHLRRKILTEVNTFCIFVKKMKPTVQNQ